jgi:DNA-binding response OmpR family regulator/DNA-binding CsgD family transcriptional regulator
MTFHRKPTPAGSPDPMAADPKRRDVVLVVDDSPETLRLLTDALDGAGMTVMVALDGAGAMRIVEQITPDIVLLDAVMPGIDGFETCRRLKHAGGLGHVPVIFMTGLADTEHIVRGLEAGGVDYVTKPIAIEEMLARIRVHLANARLAQSARLALDATGRNLFALDRDGRLVWATPQAQKLLPDLDGGDAVAALRGWLAEIEAGKADARPPAGLLASAQHRLQFLGRLAPNEFLLRISRDGHGETPAQFAKELGLTAREAEVLAWLSQGKANRDIAQILGLSPRTVDKHLEQIYAKLGVENRTAAAAIAVQATRK